MERKGKGMKYFRKTGAQTLTKQFPETPHIVKQYLGHKERDVVRHYRKQDYALLFKGLEWMEKHFDLASAVPQDRRTIGLYEPTLTSGEHSRDSIRFYAQ